MAPAQPAITPAQITGVVLAGGRGTRMGGVDKGLQLFHGVPLALHALRRLQVQVSAAMVNANRHLDSYQGFGVPVWPDRVPGYLGPLAGFITALQHCATPYMATVPCDVPFFPADLVARLARGLVGAGSEIAVPSTETAGLPAVQIHPVFCLMHTRVLPSLEQFVASGGRKVEDWITRHASVWVPFDTPRAFFNVNTLAQLEEAQKPAG